MKKKIINGLLVATILFIAISVIGIIVLDGVAQSVIQSKATEGLGVNVKLDSVHVGVLTRTSSIKGLTIANPEPFLTEENPNLLTVTEATADFSVFQMLDKEVNINKVFVEGVTLYLQQDTGLSNIETVINTISNDETPNGSHPEPPFTIAHFIISDITVIASGKFTILDKGAVTAHIDQIVMHDIGTDGDAEVVAEAITSAVTHAILQHLSNNPVEGFSKIAFSKVTEMINGLPVFHQLGIGTAIQNVTDTTGKVIDSVIGGIGNLLGGNKDNGKK
ncbi:MAG: hypothetical protein HOI88_08970 [Phycisphaerae bacterium]|nr:hypothetical protein [Phycisphaerae bacterium]MBT6270460.1 hypothetical protein [Phycisphaerae bacterium]